MFVYLFLFYKKCLVIRLDLFSDHLGGGGLPFFLPAGDAAGTVAKPAGDAARTVAVCRGCCGTATCSTAQLRFAVNPRRFYRGKEKRNDKSKIT